MSGRDKSKLKRGVNGMPYLELRHPSGAQLDVYLHGAHAVSWRAADGGQMLFMSRDSAFKPDAPIRGGIPVVFPQFGDGPLPKHGFARIQEWTFISAGLSNNGCAEAGFELKDNEETIKLWPHKFRLKIIFLLKAAELEISFSVTNTGKKEFEFKNGLHTYFSVADISRILVKGLVGTKFFDPSSPESPVACHREEWRSWLRRVPQRCPAACRGVLHILSENAPAIFPIFQERHPRPL
ncbi:MAG: hypothetical protein Q8N81_06535, partial [bacterium]|nr:hypothetical protein [bacterium]